ncbi:MAG: hypothetical protein IJ523_02695 [Succinivibrionaceae bacterium]|nr:hypothetical protein [Succinivibrionaceae bacterium]
MKKSGTGISKKLLSLKILFLGEPGPQIEEHFTNLGLNYTVRSEPVTLEYVAGSGFTYAVVYRYSHLIPRDVVLHLSGSIIGLHPSLLPLNRGFDPVFWTFADNTPAGITIYQVDSAPFAGAILLQKELSFDREDPNLTLAAAETAICREMEQMFCQNFKFIAEDRFMKRPQYLGDGFHSAEDIRAYQSLLENGKDVPVVQIRQFALKLAEEAEKVKTAKRKTK